MNTTISKKSRRKTAKDMIAEFYHKPYTEILAMANSDQIEQDTELDWGEGVGNEVLDE
ncbi:hypothetical protein [Bilifractor sp. HCP3S3_D3]|uniref:hypothetical protein n=1 Tax=Bilifractor sp. HCP3S3_D3 TaxID=3438907 RepID=UPI003F8C3BBD